MPDWENDSDAEQGTGVLTEPKERVDKPRLYKVLPRGARGEARHHRARARESVSPVVYAGRRINAHTRITADHQ